MINKKLERAYKTKKIVFEKNKNNLTTAQLVAEPLESGYGQTLGNMLRRVLLSSIRGAAVTSIMIEGVTHEFTSIPGVIEDVTEIILNIKQLAIKLNDVESTKIYLRSSGAKKLTAADIDCGAHVEILNKDLHICTTDSKATVNITMHVSEEKALFLLFQMLLTKCL